MSGITTATVIAGIGAAASAAVAVKSLTTKAPKADGGAAEGQVTDSTNSALQARSALLETAGGAGGSPLAPGQVGASKDTIFGN